MLFAQVGLGGDFGAAISFGVIGIVAGLMALKSLLLGLVAFVASFGWRRWPRLDEYYAIGSGIFSVLYVAVWLTWGQMPTSWQIFLAALAGPIIGALSAWRSNVRRSRASEIVGPT